MEVIYTLIPGMIFFGLIIVNVLIWTIKKSQYEDMDNDANHILMDDDDPKLPGQESKKDNNKTDKKKVDQRNWPDAN